MKLSLVVLAAGKNQGKAIPVPVANFIIGRDPQCQLRPASPLISMRHCALLQREGKVFVCDFGSTNGTFINDRQVKGEIEVQHGDCLKAGPLAFRIEMEAVNGLGRPTPLPPGVRNPGSSAGAPGSTPVANAPGSDPGLNAPGSSAAPSPDDDVAAILLSLQEDGGPVPGSPGVDSSGVPTGSTVMDMIAPPSPETAPAEGDKAAPTKARPAPPKSGDTSAAAKTILEKYWPRPRA